MGKSSLSKLSPVKMVVLVAIGTALYGLGGLLSVPVFANTYLKPAMAVLALWAAVFGPVVGFLVGLLGHFITDLCYGSVWWTWALGSGIVGILIGLYPMITKKSLEDGIFGVKEIVIFIVLSFAANFVGYLISAILDFFLFAEPLNKVITQQLITAFSNTVCIGVIGSILMALIAKRNVAGSNLED